MGLAIIASILEQLAGAYPAEHTIPGVLTGGLPLVGVVARNVVAMGVAVWMVDDGPDDTPRVMLVR